jgi:3-methyladenine DNA glycosylase AlkC
MIGNTSKLSTTIVDNDGQSYIHQLSDLKQDTIIYVIKSFINNTDQLHTHNNV